MKYSNHRGTFLENCKHIVTTSNPIQINNALTINNSQKNHNSNWCKFLQNCKQLVSASNPLLQSGTLTRVAGLVMEAVGLKLAVGSSCTVVHPNGNSISAEVVGFSGDRLFLMPSSDVYGLVPGAKVIPTEFTREPPKFDQPQHPRRRATDRAKHVAVGLELLGRVLNGAGEPLDQLGSIHTEHSVPLYSRPYNPLERIPVSEPLDVGVRAINTLLTVGRGQRMGLFAGSGVGKSVLLGMMARYTCADVIVVALIGELLHPPILPRYFACKVLLMQARLPNISVTQVNMFFSSWIPLPVMLWHSVKLLLRLANRRRPRVIHPLYSPSCRNL